jgi:hypothetical protein
LLFFFFALPKKETKNASAGLFADPLFSQFLNPTNSLRSNSVGFYRIFEKREPGCHSQRAG